MAMRSRQEARAVAAHWRETHGDDRMSTRGYLFTIALLIAAGIALSVASAYFTLDKQQLMLQSIWTLLGASAAWMVIVMIAGAAATVTERWLVSLLSYAVITVATGAYIGPFVDLYVTDSVITVLAYTVLITFSFGVLGLLWPHSVEHWYGLILGATIALVAAYFGAIVLALFGIKSVAAVSVLDWAGIVLFSVWIFWDMNMALRMPPNFNNAVVVAINLYLNMVNIFIRLLAQLGQLKEVAADLGSVAADAAGSLG